MKKAVFITLVSIEFFSWNSYAQKTKRITEDNNNNQTIDPLKTYERLIDNGFTSKEMCKKLGDAYFFKNNFEEASKYYSELFKLSDKQDAEYYLRFGQSLKKIGQLEKSNEMLSKYKILTNQ
ncbi:tetratricopeptide repeat protein [Flavobacterium sp. RSSA_27]|uniref:tetratricopeptide repeat protein n=1 Tax=Flavobacterium sp. RSSA_27 TaxID=3447667 RepID=UPI003F2BF43F